MLHEDKGDHEDLTAPLLVIALISKNEFQEGNIAKYTYEARYTINVDAQVYQLI